MSTDGGAGPERLRGVPWGALEGLGGVVAAGVGEVLSGKPAERVVDQVLRAHRRWTADQRQAVVEALFGVGLWRRRLAYALGLPLSEASAAALVGSLLRDLAGVDPDLASRLAGSVLPPPRAALPPSLGERHSLPDWLCRTLERELGPSADAFAFALNLPGPIFLRANRLLNAVEPLRQRLISEGVSTAQCRFARHGLVVLSTRPNLLALPSFREGRFEVQDEGSQLLGALLGARPGEAVLDFCAGAGGKTLQLAGEVGRSGRVHACDPDGARLDRLRQRCARAKTDHVAIHGAQPPADLLVAAVLVDAPCSELGTLRRGPDLRFRLDPATFEPLPVLQRAILERAQRHVGPGGRLVYATCTLRREENEEVALAFERSHPEFHRVTPGEGWLPGGFVSEGFFRCAPHLHGTDAFFAAVYRRSA